MNDISRLQFEVNLIKNEDIRDLTIKTLRDTAPSYFWEITTSSTGRYHPTHEDGTPYTLVDHTKSATRFLRLLLTHPLIAGRFSAVEIDLMTSAILLHDLAKRGLEETTYTVHEHPLLVRNLRPKNLSAIQNNYFDQIIFLAEPHTGPWRRNIHSDVVLPEIKNYGQYIVHMADWLSSRRVIRFDLSDSKDVFNYVKDINS